VDVAYKEGRPYVGGAHLRLGGGNIVLHDRTDKPVVKCVDEGSSFKIYGTRPFVAGDRDKRGEGGMGFFPWFRVQQVDDVVSIEIRNHSFRYDPLWYAERKEANEVVVRSALDDATVCEFTRKDGWEMNISPGIDPALMICLSAMLERMVVE
jgi:hypothetical protein